MSATHDHVNALLAAAERQDGAGLQNAATAAMRDLERAQTKDLIAMLAWAAGCLSRRVPGGVGPQVLRELQSAPGLVGQNPFVRPGGGR